jgi:hypothetical protein
VKIEIKLTKAQLALVLEALHEYGEVLIDGAWKYGKGGKSVLYKSDHMYKLGKKMHELCDKLPRSKIKGAS